MNIRNKLMMLSLTALLVQSAGLIAQEEATAGPGLFERAKGYVGKQFGHGKAFVNRKLDDLQKTVRGFGADLKAFRRCQGTEEGCPADLKARLSSARNKIGVGVAVILAAVGAVAVTKWGLGQKKTLENTLRKFGIKKGSDDETYLGWIIAWNQQGNPEAEHEVKHMTGRQEKDQRTSLVSMKTIDAAKWLVPPHSIVRIWINKMARFVIKATEIEQEEGEKAYFGTLEDSSIDPPIKPMTDVEKETLRRRFLDPLEQLKSGY